MGSASASPADSKLVAGAPRVPAGTPSAPLRDTSNDIWASDVHLTPDGKFLYAAERTSSTIAAFAVDGPTGKLTYVASTVTEKQPRGFRIDPTGWVIVVSGEKPTMRATYASDASTGALTGGRYPPGNGPNWVEIVSFD